MRPKGIVKLEHTILFLSFSSLDEMDRFASLPLYCEGELLRLGGVAAPFSSSVRDFRHFSMDGG